MFYLQFVDDRKAKTMPGLRKSAREGYVSVFVHSLCSHTNVLIVLCGGMCRIPALADVYTVWGIKKNGGIFVLPAVLSFDFDFFFHVNLLPRRIVEDILQKRKFLVWNNLDAESVLHLPLPFQRNDSLIDVGSNVRMDV